MRNRSHIVFALALMLPVMAGAEELFIKHELPEVSLVTQMAPAPMPKLPAEGNDIESSGGSEAPKSLKTGRKLSKQQTAAAVFPKPPVSAVNSDKNPPSLPKIALGSVLDNPVILKPEAVEAVQLSSSDLNRVICSDGDIGEILADEEKGLTKPIIIGKDAWLKFEVVKLSNGEIAYTSTPITIYVTCGKSTYGMTAFPARVPGKTIRLSSGTESRIKENQSLYAGLPFEKRVMRVIRETYTDNIPESYSVSRFNQVDMTWKGLVLVLKRIVDVEGEGMKVKEYHISLKKGQQEPFKLTEKMFLRKEFVLNPIAVSIDKHILKAGETSRLFVVEQRAETSLNGNGMKLPSLEVGSIAPAVAEQSQPPQGITPPSGIRNGGNGSKYNPRAIPGGV